MDLKTHDNLVAYKEQRIAVCLSPDLPSFNGHIDQSPQTLTNITIG